LVRPAGWGYSLPLSVRYADGAIIASEVEYAVEYAVEYGVEYAHDRSRSQWYEQRSDNQSSES
jgi:hypothetical protein